MYRHPKMQYQQDQNGFSLSDRTMLISCLGIVISLTILVVGIISIVY